MSEDEKLAIEYFQGRACCERGGYRSDNPHLYESERWETWLLGFDDADLVYSVAAR